MGSITMEFANEINESLQVNDTVYYYSAGDDEPNWETGDYTPPITKLGACTAISADRKSLTCNIDDSTPRPTVGNSGNLITFVKNNKVNTTSLKGYYLELKLTNTTSKDFELFSVGSEIVESSK